LPQISSVQLVIETSMARLLKRPVAINGCGRTDSHVHAMQYFFHVDLEEEFTPQSMFRLNKVLPNDIAVFDVIPMEGVPHARLDATSRKYEYFIHDYKDPFLACTSALYDVGKLDLQKMKAATLLLTRYNDYRLFFRTASKPKTTLCNVTDSELYVDQQGHRLKFTISANRFLSGMVRIIVYRLLQVGMNKLTVEQFENYLNLKEVPMNIRSAYPQGLYLSKVTYPFLDVPARTSFHHIMNGGSLWTAL
jgi:tRNA pseudouridine38-40 synthase